MNAITLEVAEKLAGPWHVNPNFSLAKSTGVEGPQCFLLTSRIGEKQPTWCLLLDHFARKGGYHAYTSQNLDGAQFEASNDTKFPFKSRHGSVLPISAEECSKLVFDADFKGKTLQE